MCPSSVSTVPRNLALIILILAVEGHPHRHPQHPERVSEDAPGLEREREKTLVINMLGSLSLPGLLISPIYTPDGVWWADLGEQSNQSTRVA